MPPLIQIPVAILVLVAGIYDIRYRRIPNWLVLPAIPVAFALNAFLFAQPEYHSSAWAGLLHSAKGFGLATLIYMPLYILRGMGAGDVKLSAALGALVGWQDWWRILILSAALGLLLALVLMALHKRFRKTLGNTARLIWELIHIRAPHRTSEELDLDSPRSYKLPHGAVIALGTLALLGLRVFLPSPAG
jgi:prepilin peptidase CpaA